MIASSVPVRGFPQLLLLRILAGALLAAMTLSVTVKPAGADLQPSMTDVTKAAVQQILSSLVVKSSTSDPRYLANNIWHDGTPDCFRCTLGPSVLAAAYATSAGLGDQTVSVVTATFDQAIRDHQRADGAIIPAAGGEGGPDIQTLLFANELAETYLMLGLRLDIAHQMQWSASLTKSADWLIRNGNVTYYSNGNLNLALSMYLDLTYRITHLDRFQTAAKSALAFTLNPPQKKWAGFGLHYTKKPTQADGSDGSGYLAERGGSGKPGYDPAYTLAQVDLASFWFLLTGSDDSRRLTNLLFNQLMPRVRISDWTINVDGGTRRSGAGLRYGFTVSALPVLYYKGGRRDLEGLVRSQTLNSYKTYANATSFPHASYSFGFGSELAQTAYAITSTPFA